MDGQQELDGMPARWGLRVIAAAGRTLVFHGPVLLFDFAGADTAMRNLALVALTGSGLITGKDAGPLFGVRPEHISRLRSAHERGGTAGGGTAGGGTAGGGRAGGGTAGGGTAGGGTAGGDEAAGRRAGDQATAGRPGDGGIDDDRPGDGVTGERAPGDSTPDPGDG